MLVYETEKITQRKAAIIVGVSTLIMVILAGFSSGFVHSSLVIKGDAAVTMNNILQSMQLFRGEILGWFVILVLDIIIAWASYVFLKQIDNSLALLGAWLRIAYAAFLGIAISNLILITILLSGDSYLASIPTEQLQSQMMIYLNAFNSIWSLGLIIFGLHLFILANMVLKSTFIPKIIGILLLIASFGYILVHSLHLFLSQFENTTAILENILTLPMAIGELSLALWLLIKGGKVSTPSKTSK